MPHAKIRGRSVRLRKGVIKTLVKREKVNSFIGAESVAP